MGVLVPRPLLADAGSSVSALPASAASDASLSREERVAAFDALRRDWVGDTLLTRARNLERRFGLRELWLKFEGDNPTGTQKDRIAFAHAQDALARGYEAVTVATCGNYGVALATAARLAGLQCTCVVPEPYHTRRVVEMQAQGAAVVRRGATYEDAVAASSAEAVERGWYDANPGGANEQVQVRAYADIAHEVVAAAGFPAAVAVPVSNGTTLAGVAEGFRVAAESHAEGRAVAVVGGSALRKNPVVDAFERGWERCGLLDPTRLRETVVNEPLINWRSFDGDLALHAIRDSGGFAAGASDRRLRELARLLADEQGLRVLPASTAGLHALLAWHERSVLSPDRYLAVLTGRSS